MRECAWNEGARLRLLRDDGWYLLITEGSHRQFKHLTKKGRVTVPGKPNDDLPHGTLNSVLAGRFKVIGERRMRYAIVIEKSDNNYAAYVPDLPGCVATGETIAETELQIREAIDLHLRGMREDGLPIPEPSSSVDYVEIAA